MRSTRKNRRKSSRSSKKCAKSEILYELEILVDRLIDEFGWQWGDLLYWLWGHLNIHRPDAQEVYEEDNTNPVFKYGPMEE